MTLTAIQEKIQAKQEKRQQLAQISPAGLNDLSDKDLRELCKGLISGYSKMNRAAKIEALTAEIHAYQPEDQIDIQTDASQLQTRRDLLGSEIYEAIKNAVTKAIMLNEPESIPMAISAIAVELIASEQSRFANITTRKARRTDYLNKIRQCFEADQPIYKAEIEQAIDAFKTLMYRAWKNEVIAEDQSRSEQVLAANSSRVRVPALHLYNQAIETLSNPKGNRWERIAKSIAFATGRRSSEIMCSAQFEKHPNKANWLLFKGQAKRREGFDPDYQYEIPCLVPVDLVLEGMVELGKRRAAYDPSNKDTHVASLQAADRLTSKQLSNECKGQPSMSDRRKIYTTLSYEIFDPNHSNTLGAWAHKVLGHDGSTTAATETYQRYLMDPAEVKEIRRNLDQKI